jgi:hypothetical protein
MRLFKDDCEFLLNSLVFEVKVAAVASLTVENLSEHKSRVGEVEIVPLLDAKSTVNHFAFNVVVIEQSHHHLLLLTNHFRIISPTLLEDEVVWLVFHLISFHSPHTLHDEIKILDLERIVETAFVNEKETPLQLNLRLRNLSFGFKERIQKLITSNKSGILPSC